MTLYEELCQRRRLLSSWNALYRKKSKEKKKHGKDINGLSLFEYKKKYSERLDELLQALKDKSHIVAPLKGFYKTKPGKTTKRLIGIASINDRILQKAVLEIISSFVITELKNGVSFGCISQGKLRETDEKEPAGIRGAMTHFVRAVSKGNYWVFKSDIYSFYDEIPKERVYRKIVKLLPDASLNELLRKFVFFVWGNREEIFEPGYKINKKIGIAQGPPLSPIFSNIYLIDFDKKMKNKYGERFIRYADDFIVVCKTEAEANEAKEISTKLLNIEKLKLSPDPKKTLIVYLKKEPLIFLGLKITRQKIISKKTSGEINLRLNDLINGREKVTSTIKKTNQYTQGIFQSLKNYHCQEIFDHVNKIIKNKKKIKIYSSLKLLDLSKAKSIVPMDVWSSYFQK